ncbi:hypothetical protein [Gordonia sp. (in: high G+C Gram-positive bacteria)]|uniref:hypothetical protein n=1 Tax=Gordonia sp. (in: high G+C Gram-positive bacteria) TaxID=84139 RepID=UPI003F965C11
MPTSTDSQPHQPPDSRAGWYAAPLISTALTIVLAPVVLFWFALSAMAFDSCFEPASCPGATMHVQTAAVASAASLIALFGQWAIAYWLPRSARKFIAAVPPTLALFALAVIMSTPAGQ